MLFNSVSFAIFLPIVFFLYWFVFNKKARTQNFLLLLASYFFYACWDWRFLFLLVFSTFLDYFTGHKIEKAKEKRIKRYWLYLSVVINLGFLGFFKYYNFFIESFTEVLSGFGLHSEPWLLHVILPVGISFYTFHGLSYVFDIYNDRIKSERNFIDYSVFVSFFPLLVAGPIERATHLLPQVKRKRSFNYAHATDGLRQILWGLFKKIVIADNCAIYANDIFNNSAHYSGSTLVIGVLFFTVQIYGDFSGYTDIALGTARLFGIKLLRNFAYPYFSRDIAEYWRRWHISLSSWFKDYLYIPLGGSRRGIWINIRNIFIIFVVSGFWHGAAWTFIVWGALNAVYYLPLFLVKKNRKNMDIVAKGKLFPSFREATGMLATFSLTVFGWIFFRAEDMHQALAYIATIFSKSLFTVPDFSTRVNRILLIPTVLLVLFFFVIEWLGRENEYAIEKFGFRWPKFLRYGFYYLIITCIFWFAGQQQAFIYFQF